MSLELFYGSGGAALVAVGLYGLLVSPRALSRLLAVNVMSSGVFLMLVALARRTTDVAPDPVPHAMVLTGIVVAVSATAVGVALVTRLEGAQGAAVESDSDVGGEAPP